MARKKRIWYPGATYHVMNRGNRRNSVFANHDDYLSFIKHIQSVKEKYPFKLHALCLMTNHFHMLIETENSEIGKIMQRLTSLYAEEYNHKHNCIGHLFQGRYTACLIEDENYFLEVSRYIHLNPVKANITQKPEDYWYSNYFQFVSNNKSADITRVHLNRLIGQLTETRRILRAFGNNAEGYRNFVDDKISHLEQEELIQKDIKENSMWMPDN